VSSVKSNSTSHSDATHKAPQPVSYGSLVGTAQSKAASAMAPTGRPTAAVANWSCVPNTHRVAGHRSANCGRWLPRVDKGRSGVPFSRRSIEPQPTASDFQNLTFWASFERVCSGP
jgi:hypothetical protein